MAKNGLINVTANNTFQVWLDRTNELVDLMGSDVITASVGGDNTGTLGTPKNANLFGTFSANTVIANTRLRADTIDDISGSGITFDTTVMINSASETVALETFSNSLDPVIRINNNTVFWDVGFDGDSQSFIINDGSSTNRLKLTPAGNLTVTGEITAATGGFTGNLTGDVTGNLTGDVTGNLTGDVTGNADTASVLAASRLITLSGDVSGSASFDGSSNITITAAVLDDSHNHTIANIDGLQTQLDDKISSVVAGTGLSGGGASGAVTLNGTTQSEATWIEGASTTESLVSPAKVKAVIDSTRSSDAGAIGSYVFARGSADTSFGSTVSGTNLYPTSAWWQLPFDAQFQSFPLGSQLSGTWRCMGEYDHDLSYDYGGGATLWLRIE